MKRPETGGNIERSGLELDERGATDILAGHLVTAWQIE
jgi:hypothetical protein